MRALSLAVEVLSEGSRRHDRLTKRRVYHEVGVAEYWVVDIEGGVVERWSPGVDGPEVLAESLKWRPDERVPPLAIDVRKLVEAAAALGDEGV